MPEKKVIFDTKNVLVIGGAGFIGSNLCTELVKTCKVICVDNFSTGREENIDHLLYKPHFKFVKHDMSQPIDFSKLPGLESFEVAFQGIQEIYDAACPTSSKHFEDFFIDTLLANSYVVKNALDLAVKYKSHFMYLSTSSIYGNPLEHQTEFNEKYWGFVDPVGLRSCYNEGKRFAETMVSTYRRKYNLDAKIARIFNCYGPKMGFDSGRMIPDMIFSAHSNEDLLIHGDGTETKSYCYVDDIIDGLLKFMKSGELGPMNFGTTEKYSILAIAQKIITLANSKSKINYDAPLPGILKQALPDATLAKTRLGWFPVVRLDEGLQRTLKEMIASKVLRYSDFTKNPSGSNMGQKYA